MRAAASHTPRDGRDHTRTTNNTCGGGGGGQCFKKREIANDAKVAQLGAQLFCSARRRGGDRKILCELALERLSLQCFQPDTCTRSDETLLRPVVCRCVWMGWEGGTCVHPLP